MRKLLIMFMALLCTIQLWAQQSVTGKVTDDKGLPVPNVSVQVKGGNTGPLPMKTEIIQLPYQQMQQH